MSSPPPVPDPAFGSSLRNALGAHDHSQLELEFDYLNGSDEHPNEFAVDIYLVVPPALRVNSDTYPRDRFFTDMTQRMRLHTPDVPEFFRGCVTSLDDYLALELDLRAKSSRTRRVVQDVKLFANHVNRRLKRLAPRPGLPPEDDWLPRLREIVETVDVFRTRYAARVRSRSLLVDDEVRSAVLAAEEYAADKIDQWLSKTGVAVGADGRALLGREVVAVARPHLLGARSDAAALERLHHRYGNLKKYVSEVLYLQPRSINREKLYRNLAAALGAGLAAAFAETARVYNTIALVGTQDFGFRFAFFLSLAVTAYVFKDRLKDLSKEYLGKRVKDWLPDRESALDYPYVDAQGAVAKVQVAVHRENLFYRNTDALPDDVAYVHDRLVSDPHPVGRRDALHYAKLIKFERGVGGKLDRPSIAMKDVIRFDTSAFLTHFDNPLKELAMFDAWEGFVVREAPKVYHLDVVVRLGVRSGPAGQERERVHFLAARGVLDKTGIVRVEEPVPLDRYRYERAVG